MKKFAIAAVAALSLLAAACTTTEPLCATGATKGSKVGTSSASFLFGALPIPLTNSYSIQDACENGGITKVSTVDVKTNNLLNLWVTKTTIVTGE